MKVNGLRRQEGFPLSHPWENGGQGVTGASGSHLKCSWLPALPSKQRSALTSEHKCEQQRQLKGSLTENIVVTLAYYFTIDLPCLKIIPSMTITMLSVMFITVRPDSSLTPTASLYTSNCRGFGALMSEKFLKGVAV